MRKKLKLTIGALFVASAAYIVWQAWFRESHYQPTGAELKKRFGWHLIEVHDATNCPDWLEGWIGPEWRDRLFDRHISYVAFESPEDQDLKELLMMPNLSRLWVVDCEKLTNEGYDQLAHARKLKVLWLSDDGLDDNTLRFIAELSELASLHLTSKRITDAGLQHLKKLSNLRELRLHEAQFTSKGIEELQRSLPNCEIILTDSFEVSRVFELSS